MTLTKWKGKKNIVISNDVGKMFTKSNTFIIKILNKLGIEVIEECNTIKKYI